MATSCDSPLSKSTELYYLPAYRIEYPPKPNREAIFYLPVDLHKNVKSNEEDDPQNMSPMDSVLTNEEGGSQSESFMDSIPSGNVESNEDSKSKSSVPSNEEDDDSHSKSSMDSAPPSSNESLMDSASNSQPMEESPCTRLEVKLFKKKLWRKFKKIGNEMIVTKPGRYYS